MTLEERYLHDPLFNRLVDMFLHYADQEICTLTDICEAAYFAQVVALHRMTRTLHTQEGIC